jgi:hypothetical protein
MTPKKKLVGNELGTERNYGESNGFRVSNNSWSNHQKDRRTFPGWGFKSTRDDKLLRGNSVSPFPK